MKASIDWMALGRRMVDQVAARSPDTVPTVREEPAGFYTDPGRFVRELKSIFLRTPLFAATSAELSEPGDYLALELANVPVMLVRGKDGRVRGFRNTCRHRGARLLEGSGSGLRAIVCPYHAWSYNSEGRLVGVPSKEFFPGVSAETHSLGEIQVAEGAGLIFLQIEGSAPLSVEEHLGAELFAELNAYGWQGWDATNPGSTKVTANWKLTMDTYGECYHCPVLHRETLPGLAGNLGGLDYYGRHIRQIFVNKSVRELSTIPESDWQVDKIKNHVAVVYLVYPNLVLATSGDGVQLMTVRPDSAVDQSLVHQIQLVSPKLPERIRARLEGFLTANWKDVVCAQDFPIIEGVWSSLITGGIERMTFGQNEAALQHLHASWAAGLEERNSNHDH